MLSWDFWIECRIYIELELRYSKEIINYLIRLASETFFINKNVFFVKVRTYWCLLLCGQYFIDWHYVSEYYCATDDGRFIVDYVLVWNILFWLVWCLYPEPRAIVLQSHESKEKFTSNYVDYVKCRRPNKVIRLKGCLKWRLYDDLYIDGLLIKPVSCDLSIKIILFEAIWCK